MARSEKHMPGAASKELISTGQAAELCSVTADAVLKWIKSGRICAGRTAGGHYRIQKAALMRFLDSNQDGQRAVPERVFRFCWEYYGKAGQPMETCHGCVVFRSRAMRCYEINRLPFEGEHARAFCPGSCDECEYYRVVQGQRLNVLVIADDPRLLQELTQAPDHRDFKIRLAADEYECSMIIENFRPDYVVINSSMGKERCQVLIKRLATDPRIPFVKAIMAGSRIRVPAECEKMIFAFVDSPVTISGIEKLIGFARQT
jgi:excisionase family DNA binding protein